MIFVWFGVGLLAFLLAVLITAAAIHSVRSKGRFRVELEAPEFSGYGGQIVATFDTEQELVKFLLMTYHKVILAPEPQQEAYDARGHAERIP